MGDDNRRNWNAMMIIMPGPGQGTSALAKQIPAAR